MERMVLDAVKGTSTAVPSRTDQLLLRTPLPSGFLTVIQAMLNRLHSMSGETSDSGESCTLGDISIPGESDSIGKMALISQSFKKSSDRISTPQVQETATTSSLGKRPELDYSSSGDATLSEVRRQTLGEKEQTTGKTNCPRRARDSHNEESLWRNSSPRLGGPVLLYPDPLTPSITLTWCGVTCVKKKHFHSQ